MAERLIRMDVVKMTFASDCTIGDSALNLLIREFYK